MTSAPYTLVLLRHGESEWNAKNLFTGWVDVPLTDKGRAEAARGGQLIAEAGVLPDVLHTSVLRRAITTAHLALDACDRHWIPVRRSWRLNERHYGALQGKDKKATLEEYGEEQFMLWRRSYDTPPPPIADDDEWSQTGAPRVRRPRRRDPAAHRVPGRRRGPDAALLVRRDRARPAHRADRLRRRARQLAARAGQAPRRDVRGGRRRAEHPHRHPAGLPARRAPAPDACAAASTSTRTPPPTPSRRSPTRAADRPARSGHQPGGEEAAHALLVAGQPDVGRVDVDAAPQQPVEHLGRSLDPVLDRRRVGRAPVLDGRRERGHHLAGRCPRPGRAPAASRPAGAGARPPSCPRCRWR